MSACVSATSNLTSRILALLHSTARGTSRSCLASCGSLGVKRERVEEAIAWLDERWRGGVFVPDELLPLVEPA